jgi:Protein of unknown function (DUF3592)
MELPMGLTDSDIRNLFAAFMAVLGFAALCVGSRNWLRARTSQRWPTTPGRVTRARIRSSPGAGADGLDTIYEAAVSYTYTVNGRQYQSDRISFGHTSGRDKSDVARIVDRYGRCREVVVHYDPKNPQLAVLEPSTSGVNKEWFGMGMSFLGLAAVCLLLWTSHETKPLLCELWPRWCGL